MRNWKAILGIMVVFILGGLAGALGTTGFYQQRYRRIVEGGPPGLRVEVVQRMSHQLDLDEPQRTQLQAILLETHTELGELRKQMEPKSREIFQRMDAKIRALLRPEQLQKYEDLVAERKRKMEELRAKWGDRPREGPPPESWRRGRPGERPPGPHWRNDPGTPKPPPEN